MGLSDKVRELISLGSWELRRKVLELRDALRKLDREEAHDLLEEGLSKYDREVDKSGPEAPWVLRPRYNGMKQVLWISQMRPDVCKGLPAKLWRRGVLGRGILYRGADANTRDCILEKADTILKELAAAYPAVYSSQKKWSDPSINKYIGEMKEGLNWRSLDVLLGMLAWIGDDTVAKWFHGRRNPANSWGSVLYRSVDDYVSEGGWELTPAGGRRNLTLPHASQLVEVGGGKSTKVSSNPVAVMVPAEGKCLWCGRIMTTFLDLDLRHRALGYLGLDGTRLRLLMCEECSLWNELYTDVDLNGGARWSRINAKGANIYNDIDGMHFSPVDHSLCLGPSCASPFEVVARGDSWDVSQLGGMPSWVQEAGYVLCPSCSMRMMFVGQVAPEAITDKAIDGVLYGMLCVECLHAIVIYQCT